MALDRWEARLEDLFRGRPFDMLDAALADTVARYPVDIQVSLLLSLSSFPISFHGSNCVQFIAINLIKLLSNVSLLFSHLET